MNRLQEIKDEINKLVNERGAKADKIANTYNRKIDELSKLRAKTCEELGHPNMVYYNTIQRDKHGNENWIRRYSSCPDCRKYKDLNGS